MAFWLKKAVSFWLMPLPVCLVLIVTGLWLLLVRRRPRPGRGLLIGGVLLLLLFSNGLVSTWLLRPLESQYPAIPELASGAAPPAALARCRYVVVLGGGHSDTDKLPATGKLSPFARARLLEGLRLLRVLPEARLIVSGGADGSHPSHAAVLAQAAMALGVSSDRIIKLEATRDTGDEAQTVRRLIGDAPVALVTSAWHLPRATGLFQQAGVDALPCPADFLAVPSGEWSWRDLLCDANSLNSSTYAVHEYLGRLWVWLRGKA